MKSSVLLLATAALALVAPATLPAQTAARVDTVDASLPTQLPRTAIPHHYALNVTPHAERLTFDGTAAIDLEIIKPTRELTLNAADLTFSSARLVPASGAPLTGTSAVNADSETATFTFPKVLPVGTYRLELTYAGKINTQANGLFALDYKNREGKDARAIYTQFEAADARRFMPSWDEPDYKATFDLTVRVPAAQMAVSNMPAASSRNIAGGLKEVRFQTTPTMSSYLLFLGAGDLDRVTKQAAGREVGIVTTRGNGDKAGWALDAEAQILPFYNDYFGTPYPLPKLDNVAGPGQSQFFGAMENWGAIFTFESVLLDDPAITSEAQRHGIFSTEAHEMAHQWFGDLVTMAWWDDLWLNEGFASWMENKATQHFHPDWAADIDRVGSREAAMGLDSLNSTHPVVQQVRTVEQANQAFDTISYQKGESVISMLEAFATPDVWRAGIRRYVATHAYQNTRTTDLWAAAEAAGARGLTTVATDFTTQPGVPLITVGASRCVGGNTVATLTQGQYSVDRRAEVSARPLSWHVPVSASAGGAMAKLVTSGRTAQLSVPGCGPLLVNAGQYGYFRTLYTPQQNNALVGVLPRLSGVDQYGLFSNGFEMSLAGYQPMAAGLDLLGAVPRDANAKVTQYAANYWTDLYDLLEGDKAAQTALATRIRAIYGPRLTQLGFAPRTGEASTDALLRPRLIDTLGKVQDPRVAAEANRLFGAWKANPNAIFGSLKTTWLSVIARNADAATWEAIHQKALSTSGNLERTALYRLLGSTRDEALARRALDLSLTAEPGKTTSAAIITSVAAAHPKLAVNFVLSHLAQVNQLIDISGRSRFMQRLVQGSHDPAFIPILEDYASKNLKPTDRKPIQQVIDRLRSESTQLPRVRSETAAWLAAHPAG
ncbi:M1 family metallopeptidase [Sphingomonas flavescens]|uniref:M1 family metallopeptidase n=1 Tax=Sphingomonas flavescens TaxID=3132797 RepID=UPI002805A895|nr:M1 family metallopeptidase [Sphingomonas limnosediminicola]